MTPTEIIIHHSAGEDRPGLDAGGIRRYHMKDLGWLAEGYHGFVERVDGDFFSLDGRRLWWPGAHCRGRNSKALGLCFIGNYNLVLPPGEMLIKGYEKVRSWMIAYNIPASAIYKHSDFAATDCPGKLFPWDKFIRLCGGQA